MYQRRSTTRITAVSTSSAPAPRSGAPYSQAVRFNDLIFVSGQLPIDPADATLVAGGIIEQTEQVMTNVAAVLRAAGSDLDKLLKVTVYLVDHDHWADLNEVYGRYVGPVPPARTAVTVAELSLGSLVEIDAIAHV